MRAPSWGDFAFAAKTFAAAMLALTIALWFDLPRPYWAVATVYITSQTFAGATRSKAIYRVCGTLIGAVMAVVLVPNLAAAPALLSLAMALWVAACLYRSLLDRTPRSYLFMLAGYTAPLIGFSCVDDPASIFDVAVARSEEICLGILCASLVSSLVLPQPVAGALSARLAAWLDGARRISADAFDGALEDPPFLQLAGEALTLETLGTHLAFDTTTRRRSPLGLATLRQHMLMALPIIAAIQDRVAALRRLDALPADLEHLLADLAAAVGSDDTREETAARLRASVEALAPPDPRSWEALLLASLAARLGDFIDLRRDLRGLIRHVAEGTAMPALLFRYRASARLIRHRDHGLALLSAIGACLAVLIACGFWIASGWPDGAGAPMFAAVACCFFAAQDDPAPAILEFAHASLLGAVVAAIYLFALLPVATHYELVIILLAPALLVCGLFMQQPATAGAALGAAVTGLALLALQGSYVAEFASFTNGAIAVMGGMWASAIVTRLVRSMDAATSARRLLRTNKATLVEAARGVGAWDGAALAALMLDRLALVAPRLAHGPGAERMPEDALLAEVRAGINVVELRRARKHVPAPLRAALERLNRVLVRTEGSDAGARSDALRATIDDALDAAVAMGEGRAVRCGLVGLRRALLPEARAYAPRCGDLPLQEAA